MYNRFAKFTAVADATLLWRGAAEALAEYAAVVRCALPLCLCIHARRTRALKHFCGCCVDFMFACCTCQGKLALRGRFTALQRSKVPFGARLALERLA